MGALRRLHDRRRVWFGARGWRGLRRWPASARSRLRRARFTPAARIAIAPLAAAFTRGRRFENAGPVELHVGVVLFEQSDGSLVDRCAADAHAGRRAEPVQQSLAAAAAVG